jgi:threonine synthase
MTLHYVSTRGQATDLPFAEVLLEGLATDGGLYVPERWPQLSVDELASMSGRSYSEIAVAVTWPFVDGAIERDAYEQLVAEAYATFDDPEVTPLRDLGGIWLLELFHGPTLAFKDVALQLLGRLFQHELEHRGERITVVGATSGDTGSAAIEGCRGRDAIDLVILHPAGRVSEVQRRQMTTVLDDNVHNVAVDGTFDDCQDLVKALFADETLRRRLNLSAVNSINWARVMAQIVYYVVASSRLVGTRTPVSFAVPTGNFGNIFAGSVAERMGLPIHRLVIGSNRNDVLTRWLATGRLELADVHPTLSPSMDIAVSSNHERLLFELSGRRGDEVADLLGQFRSEGNVELPAAWTAAVGDRWAASCLDDAATLDEIRRTYESTGVLVDPHTAVGLGAARSAGSAPGDPLIALATAHPAKFPDAVEQATGVRPDLPEHLADLLERPERCASLPNDLDAVRSFVEQVSRV